MAPAESAASFFGSLGSKNYSENNVKIWKNRSNADADFNFKLGLGDAFYHGLTLMTRKNATIKEQERAISSYKDDISILKGQVTDYHKKYQDEIKARKE